MYSLNHQHLRYFWAISRHGNLTRASAELHLTPQTISSQIRDLENGLGVELFSREGRRLVLTDIGRVVYRYADEIFSIGQKLQDTVRGLPSKSLRLVVGVADVVPKLIAHRLIAPATQMADSVRIICREDKTDKLLIELVSLNLDIVLSDSPVPPAVKIPAYDHLMGESGVVFMGVEGLARICRKGFPASINDVPILLPTKNTVLRHDLERWFDRQKIRPMVVGEFEDSALLKTFGQAGAGIFAVSSMIQDEVERQYGVEAIGMAEGVIERFYAISLERKMSHPAVVTICKAARLNMVA